MSIKTERLGNVLHREISNILMSEIKDKDLNFVTITKNDGQTKGLSVISLSNSVVLKH